MMRSMFSGVTGLRTHQTRMDVVGNNIANVNTVGFKSGRVTFQEVFSQTLRGAGAPDPASGRGGTNPMQVGLGIGIGSLDTIMNRGSLQRTDNPTDLSIQGEGFFVVKGGTADTYKFTRAGNFSIDSQGNLVNGNGMNVYGWQQYTQNTDGSFTYNTENTVEPINFYGDDYNLNKRMIAAQSTSSATFAGNLNSALAVVVPAVDDAQFSVPMTVYDSLGNSYEISIDFYKTDVDGVNAQTTWQWEVNAGAMSAATGEIVFDEDGQILDTIVGSEPVQTVTLTPDAATGTTAFDVELDFTKVTMYAADSSVKTTNVNGYTTGNLVTFSIGSDGIITGIYSNGQQQPLGLVGLALFENPAGLQKVGENLFIQTTNSGEFKKGSKPGADGVGTLSPGTLEMSNVDLSKEFTEMIITQRGFQANSRIITTSDEMLQELVNLKR